MDTRSTIQDCLRMIWLHSPSEVSFVILCTSSASGTVYLNSLQGGRGGRQVKHVRCLWVVYKIVYNKLQLLAEYKFKLCGFLQNIEAAIGPP